MSVIGDNLHVAGAFSADSMTLPSNAVTASAVAVDSIGRAKLVQDDLVKYAVPWEAFRVWDAYATNLPGTSATDDLGLIQGTFGTASPSIQTFDVKAAGTSTLYARFCFVLPAEYQAGETVQIRAHAGMLTTVSDGAATVDFEVYESNKEAGIGSDLCTTSATSIKSLTLADKDFTLTSAALAPGDILDCRMTIVIVDAATPTAVKGIVGAVQFLLDVKG